MMHEKLHLKCLKRKRRRRKRKRMMVEKREPPATFLSALEGINTVRKYLMKFDVDDNTTAALSSIENEVYRIQQKAKKQHNLIVCIVNRHTA
jgi:hypothetical protein